MILCQLSHLRVDAGALDLLVLGGHLLKPQSSRLRASRPGLIWAKASESKAPGGPIGSLGICAKGKPPRPSGGGGKPKQAPLGSTPDSAPKKLAYSTWQWHPRR